jgi:hypothetical protein
MGLPRVHREPKFVYTGFAAFYLFSIFSLFFYARERGVGIIE